MLELQTITPATRTSALAARGPQFTNNDNRPRKGRLW